MAKRKNRGNHAPRRINSQASEPSKTRQAPAPCTATGFSRRDALALLVLALLVAVSYFPATQAGFVWDDLIVKTLTAIRDWGGIAELWFAPGSAYLQGDVGEGHYWPLTYSTFWLEHKLWGLNPAGYHVVNILLHFANTALLWCLLRRLCVPGAWLVAAVFAVHPLHVESVAWIIERKDVLSALFYLTAVLGWIRFVEEPRRERYILVLALFVAGLLSKSIVVTLPVTLLIYHWWQWGRVTQTDLVRLVPFFLVALCITAADLSFYTSREPLSLGYSPIERVLIAARALWFYAGKLLWPTELAGIYPLWDIDLGDPLAWAYVIACIAVAALLWFGRERWGRGPLVGVAFFAVTLSPVLGFVDYGYMQFSLVADRFQYLAGIGVMGVLIGGAVHGVGKLAGAFRKGACGLAAVVLALLGVMTYQQAGIYRDEVSFFSHIVSFNPEARDVHLNLAAALTAADRPEEALTAARIAVEQRPDFAKAYSILGVALIKLNHLKEAEEILLRALELHPHDNPTHQNLGEALRKQERYEEAIASYRTVLESEPEYMLAYAGMGKALFHLGRYDEAIKSLSRAVSLQLDSPVAGSLYVLMGRASLELDRLETAEKHFQRTMEINPNAVEPLVYLASLRIAQQRFEEADEYLLRAQQLRPRDIATLQNVAEVLRKQGHHEEAIASYRVVLEIDPECAPAYAGMGDALFQLKHYEEALASLTQAFSLKSDLPMAARLHVIMGQASQELGRIEAAAEQYERALHIEPHNTEALDHLAFVRFGQKRYEEALGLYRTLIDIGHAKAQNHTNMAASLFYLGRTDEAIQNLERALSLDPNLESAQTYLKNMRRRQ